MSRTAVNVNFLESFEVILNNFLSQHTEYHISIYHNISTNHIIGINILKVYVLVIYIMQQLGLLIIKIYLKLCCQSLYYVKINKKETLFCRKKSLGANYKDCCMETGKIFALSLPTKGFNLRRDHRRIRDSCITSCCLYCGLSMPFSLSLSLPLSMCMRVLAVWQRAAAAVKLKICGLLLGGKQQQQQEKQQQQQLCRIFW